MLWRKPSQKQWKDKNCVEEFLQRSTCRCEKHQRPIHITKSEEIKEEVDKLNEKQRKGSSSEMSTLIHWFKKRGQALYWKFSDILHDLSQLDWFNLTFFDALIPMLPDFNPGDKRLLSIVHAEVKPFTSKSNIEESVVSF